MRGAAPDRIYRREVGLLPEGRRIFSGLSAEENLRIGQMQCPARSRAASSAKLDKIYQRNLRLAERGRLIDEPTEGLAGADDRGGVVPADKAARPLGIPIVLVEQNLRHAIWLTTRYI